MAEGKADPVSAARQVLINNASAEGLDGARISVARGRFGGLRIRVVHDLLSQMNDQLRRDKLLAGIVDEIESAELLTSAEEEWYGPVFTESDEPLPIWAEALENTSSPEPLIFASDLDQDIDKPAIVGQTANCESRLSCDSWCHRFPLAHQPKM